MKKLKRNTDMMQNKCVKICVTYVMLMIGVVSDKFQKIYDVRESARQMEELKPAPPSISK